MRNTLTKLKRRQARGISQELQKFNILSIRMHTNEYNKITTINIQFTIEQR